MPNPTSLDRERPLSEPRYEFRVWGNRSDASDRLLTLAAGERRERIEDCYLLDGDPACCAKIRHSRLKVKRLEEERLGFQRWSRDWYQVPSRSNEPIERLLDELRRGEVPSEDCQHLLADVVTRLDLHDALRAVFVTKHRRRFRLGSIKAEATAVIIDGRAGSLNTLAIEGPDLVELTRLRARLGLDHVSNLALHLAVDGQYRSG